MPKVQEKVPNLTVLLCKLVGFKHHQAPFEQVIEPRFGVVSGRGGRVPGGPVECAAVGGVDGGGGEEEVRVFRRVVEELKNWRIGEGERNKT